MATPFLSQPKFYAGADFNKTEAIGLLMQNLASAPSSPGTGRLYFDTTSGFARVSNGTSWVTIKDNWVSGVSGSGCASISGTNANGLVVSVTGADGSNAGSMSAAHYTLVNNATNTNTASTIVKRDSSGNFSAGTITADLNGNAATVTTNANLTGDVTSSGNATTISAGVIVNSMVSASAAIALSKLAAVAVNSLIVSNGSGVLSASANFTVDGSGNLDLSGKRLTGVGTATQATDAVNLSQLDSAKAGLDVKASVRVATAATLPSYTVSSGVITASANGALVVDGVTVATGNRILVKNETGGNAKYNGIYDVTATGGAGSAFVLTRSTDADSDAEVTTGCFTFVSEGTSNATTSWVLATHDTITLGTTDLNFTQYAGASSVTAGNGIQVVGNQISAVGTSGRITVGASIDIDSSYVGQSSITTLGTITTGVWNGTTIAVANGGTGATTASAARTNLGLVIGTDVQAYNSSLAAIAAGTWTGASSITTLGTITTGVWNGTTIAVANGGTGATTASAARTNLGLAIGTNVQAYDDTLAALAAFNTNGILVQTAADTFAGRTLTGTSGKVTVTNGDGVSGNPTVTIAADYVGQSSITTLGTITTGVWNGTTIAVANGGTGATTASGARTNLGLGTIATQDASSVSITGGSITGITDLAVADGGTGASTAAAARSNLAVMARYADTVAGDDTTTDFGIVHNLSTRDVIVSVVQASSPYAVVMTDVEATSTSTVTVKFATAPASGDNYRVVVAAIG